MAECKSCGAEIKFIQTAKNKKWMPCDPELLSADDVDAGTILIGDEGYVYEVGKDSQMDNTFLGYISHFSSCPNADEHRKDK